MKRLNIATYDNDYEKIKEIEYNIKEKIKEIEEYDKKNNAIKQKYNLTDEQCNFVDLWFNQYEKERGLDYACDDIDMETNINVFYLNESKRYNTNTCGAYLHSGYITDIYFEDDKFFVKCNDVDDRYRYNGSDTIDVIFEIYIKFGRLKYENNQISMNDDLSYKDFLNSEEIIYEYEELTNSLMDYENTEKMPLVFYMDFRVYKVL